MALEDIKNFFAVTQAIGTAGQPTEQQLREVADAGFKTVINLGLLDPRYCLPDEAGSVQSLDLSYHHIPVDFQSPKISDLEQFIACMDACGEQRTFVHCAANYRVTAFVGLYAQARWGWSREQAQALMAKRWQPNEVWTAFIEAARTSLKLA